MRENKLYTMPVSDVYPHYIAKVERKGRTKEELDTIIYWLTGYNATELQQHLEDKTSFTVFFEKSPKLNPNRRYIKGIICGHRVEEIKDPIMQNIRYLDKLVDEISKGWKLEKILRK